MGAEDVRKAQPLEEHARRLRALMRDERLSMTFRLEAEDNMERLELERPDVVNVLKACAVTDAEFRGDRWHLVADARTTEGIPVAVELVVYEEEKRVKVKRVYIIQ
jgi:hypothetical protein